MTTPRLAPSSAPSALPERLLPPFEARDDAERWLFGLERLGIRPGLERIRILLEVLGSPEQQLPALIVAGTNGKGSAAHLLADRLRDLGRRVGLYTSPHLLDLRERICIDGNMIARAELNEAVARIRPAAEACGATFFESFTAVCLDLFARAQVEDTVLEVGLGGRWDATNSARKRAVLLCSIGSDHEEILGPTVESIAREKLALAAPGIPFYVARLEPPLADLARREIEAAGAIHLPVRELPPVAGEEERAANFRSASQRDMSRFVDRVLADLARREGWRLEPARLGPGRCPARLERYGGAPELWLDPAHNEPALRALVDNWGPARPDDVLIFGCMQGKRIDAVLPLLHGISEQILVSAPRWQRSRSTAELATLIAAAGPRPVREIPRVVDALEAARAIAGAHADGGGRVLVCGSNFLVAEALDRLGVDALFEQTDTTSWDRGLPLRRRGDERA